MRTGIHDLATGKWTAILPALGIDSRHLTGRHGPCPVCGGKDRFRFDDKGGRGTFFCTHCGPGTGVDLVMRYANVDFVEAVRRIRPLAVESKVSVRKAVEAEPLDGKVYWSRALPIVDGDPVAKYLTARGLGCDPWPSQLRYMPRVPHVGDDGKKKFYPAMVANFVSPCRSQTMAHFTFLDENGAKAQIEPVKKFQRGKVPCGGAVRLAPSAETMGVAEGIETALSAAKIFDIPVWAALTAIGLTKWEPPEHVRCVIVFADADLSYAGQHAAYALAYRLKGKGLSVEVRVPNELGSDWNDVLASELR